MTVVLQEPWPGDKPPYQGVQGTGCEDELAAVFLLLAASELWAVCIHDPQPQ